MKYEILLYEAGLIFLILTLIYITVAIYKLSGIIKEKIPIWILSVVAAFVLLFALVSHIYASFIVMPQMEKTIGLLSAQSIKKAENFTLITQAIENIKSSLLLLKTFSFSCFLLASLLLTFTTGVYLRWISK